MKKFNRKSMNFIKKISQRNYKFWKLKSKFKWIWWMDKYTQKWNRIRSSFRVKLDRVLSELVGFLNRSYWRGSWDSQNSFSMKFLIIFRNSAQIILKNVGTFIARKMMIVMCVNNIFIFRYFLIEKKHILIFIKLLTKIKFHFWMNYMKLIALMDFNMVHLYYYHL